MAKIIYTLTLTQSEREAFNEFISRNLTKHSERLRTEGKSRQYLNRAVEKLANSKTVVI